MKNLVFFIFFVVCVSSCNTENTIINEVETKSSSDSPFLVSESVAIRQARTFLEKTEKAVSRSANSRQGYRADVISTVKSRTTSSDIPDYYLINFDNNEGFALVSADKRDSSVVYMASQEGNICLDSITDDSPYKLVLEMINFCHKTKIDAYNEQPQSRSREDDYEAVETTRTIANVGPLIDKKWKQRSPFNCIFDGTNLENYVMGCVPVAIGQIASYYKTPRAISVNNFGCTFDWNLISSMKNDYNLESNPEGAYQVSSLLYLIGQLCDANYNYDQSKDKYSTSVKTSKIRDVLLKLCLDCSEFTDYNLSSVVSSLNSNKPVLISARIEGEDSGHAWVVDGYEDVLTTYSTYDSEGNPVHTDVLNPYNWTDEYRYIHCNFGWGGYCNGMYLGYHQHIDEQDELNSYPTLTYVYSDVFSRYSHAATGEYTSSASGDVFYKIRTICNISK